jgi:hypothetical protein
VPKSLGKSAGSDEQEEEIIEWCLLDQFCIRPVKRILFPKRVFVKEKMAEFPILWFGPWDLSIFAS